MSARPEVRLPPYSGGRLMFLQKPQESDPLERLRGWHILAASGMCDACGFAGA